MSATALDPRGQGTGWRIALLGLAWLGGVAWQLQQAALWPAWHYGVTCIVAFSMLALAWALVRRHPGPREASQRVARGQPSASRRGASPPAAPPPPQPPRFALLLTLPALALLGFGSTGLRADARLQQRLDPALEGRVLLLTGVVATMPQIGASGTRFQFEVEAATRDARPVAVPPRIALGWYRGFNDDDTLADPWAELRAGQRWRLPVKLKQPHGALNPDGFDVELWWWEQGLRATGYVRVPAGAGPAGAPAVAATVGVAAPALSDAEATAGSIDAPTPRPAAARGPAAELVDEFVGHPVERARQTVRDAIVRRVADPRAAGVLAALAVGDQAAIERADWDLFRQTGIAHLMSISGLHVTMFAWLAGVLIAAAWRRTGRAMLWLPAPLAGRWGGLAVASGYALLAGWGVPAERTLLMLAIAVLLRSLGARWPWLLVLLAAGCAVTLLDPWALLQVGFWLSFAAVGLLMASEPALPPSRVHATGAAPDAPAAPQGSSSWRARLAGSRWRASLAGHLRSQAVATLGLAPLSMVFFQQVSVVGFVANLVAIPFVTLVVTPLALAGALLPPLWQVAAWAVQALVAGLGWLAALPFAVWSAPVAPGWALACGLIGALLGVLPLPWHLRALALPMLLPLLLPPVERPAAGSVEWLVADVGQGTAVLVRTHAHLLVYDTGPMYSRESDAGQRVLLPLLRARGETGIDVLVLSHRDIDHVGGAASVLAALPVRSLLSSLEPSHALRQSVSAPPHTRCDDGQSWTWDGVRFDVLHPTPADHATARKTNALSCVLKVSDAQGRSVLLTADIEAPQEAALIERHAAQLASNVLLVPHHGSRTSSSAAFLDAVAPQVAVVQAGYRSRFGHPAPDVMARYAERGIPVVRSDRCGAWVWHDGAAECTRDVRRRYWHWGPPTAAPVGVAHVAKPRGAGADQR